MQGNKCVILFSIALIYVNQEQFDKAKELLIRIITYHYEDFQDISGQAESCELLAELAEGQEKIQYLHQALSFYKLINDEEEQQRIVLLLKEMEATSPVQVVENAQSEVPANESYLSGGSCAIY